MKERNVPMKILNLENENRKFTKSIENFHVMEYLQDSSVCPGNADIRSMLTLVNPACRTRS